MNRLTTILLALALAATLTADEPDPDAVRVAALTYAGDTATRCFNDKFLTVADRYSTIDVDRTLHKARADGEAIYEHPLVVMAGTGKFTLTEAEIENLRHYLRSGGVLIATAKCDDTDWDASFRTAMAAVLEDHELEPLPDDHELLHTLIDIDRVQTVWPTEHPLWQVRVDGRLAVLYCPVGMTDSVGQTPECCCCGSNEIVNARQVLANALVYVVTH